SVACRRWREIPSLLHGQQALDPISPLAAAAPDYSAPPLLMVKDLSCAYGSDRTGFFVSKPHIVVQHVRFDIQPYETFALVGESGSGKSTIARAVQGLIRPVGGSITYAGQDITQPVGQREKRFRREIQLVLQNPDASLNPRQTVLQIV